MAELRDILLRTAANIGMDPAELEPFSEVLLNMLRHAYERGEEVELMTFGTLLREAGTARFRPHASLLPPEEDGTS